MNGGPGPGGGTDGLELGLPEQRLDQEGAKVPARGDEGVWRRASRVAMLGAGSAGRWRRRMT